MNELEKATLRRIRELLESRLGLTGPEEQAEQLAQWVGVQVRTARRWVAGQSFPLRWAQLLATIQRELKLSPIYLWDMDSLTKFDLESIEFIEKVWQMSPEDQNRLHRLLTRMNNNSPMVKRLQDQLDAGQIGWRDLLEIGGR